MKINELEQEVKKLSQKVETENTALKELNVEYSNVGQNSEETIVKEKLGDLYSTEKETMREKREKIIDKVSLMTDDERLVIGHFLYDKWILSFCGRGFGSYKRPTECGVCHLGERNVKSLGLEKYIEYFGKRVYRIPNEVVDEARIRLGGEYLQTKMGELEQSISDIQSAIGGLNSEIKEKNELIEIFEKLDRNGADYEKVEAEMPGLQNQLKSKYGSCGDMKSSTQVKDIKYVETDNYHVVAAMWEDHTYSMSGHGGIQWKNWVTVHYKEKGSEGEIRELHSPAVVTRNRFGADYDRKELWPFMNYVGLEAEGNSVETSWIDSSGNKAVITKHNLEQ